MIFADTKLTSNTSLDKALGESTMDKWFFMWGNGTCREVFYSNITSLAPLSGQQASRASMTRLMVIASTGQHTNHRTASSLKGIKAETPKI